MQRTTVVVEGAITASIYIILCLVSLNLPLVGLFVYFLLPIPYIIYSYKYGLKPGVVFWAVTLALSLIIGGINGLLITVSSGLLGGVMGVLYHKKKSAFAILLGGSLASLVNFLWVLSVMKFVLHFNFVKDIQDMLTEVINKTAELYKYNNQDVSALNQLREQVDLIIYQLPTTLIFSAVLLTFFTQWIAKIIMKRLRFHIHSFPPFYKWNFPRAFLWYYLVAVLLMFTNPEKGSILYNVAVNLYYILATIMFIQGLTVIYYYMWAKEKPRALSIFVTIIAFILSAILPILMEVTKLLGIMDLGFNVKKRINPGK
ncbi:YybS family protein [Fictibacillus sp. Mic-4]|uniref:YybS family protein n=1 Tax=Fictibacillus sp. Mic-4 TaxID=3132826 RepID=UPI003CF4167A